MAASEAYNRTACNMPKSLLKVNQDIHGDLCMSAKQVFIASNKERHEVKAQCLIVAQELLFNIYSSIEYCVKAKGMTIGQANEIILKLKEAHEEVKKWLNYELKQQ